MADDGYYMLKRSTRPGKKWMVRVPTSSGRGKVVHFGDSTMQDFTQHKDTARRERYRSRHQRDNLDDPGSPGFWSWHALWGESSNLKTAFSAAVRRAKKLGVAKRRNPNEEPADASSRVAAFMSDFYADTELDGVLGAPSEYEDEERLLHGRVVLLVYPSDEAWTSRFDLAHEPGMIYISRIESEEPPRSGAGTLGLRFLTDLADKHGVKLFLSAAYLGDESEFSDADLVSWYTRYGFVEKGREKFDLDGVGDNRWSTIMVREPRRLRNNPEPVGAGREYLFDGRHVTFEELLRDNQDDEDFIEALLALDVGERMAWGPGYFDERMTGWGQATFDIERIPSASERHNPAEPEASALHDRFAELCGHVGVQAALAIDEDAALAGRDPRSPRAFAATDGETVFVRPKLAEQKVERIDGVLMHELGHVILIQRGYEDHTERECDACAEGAFGVAICYDADDVQTTGLGVHPRPRHLDVEC